MKKSNGYSVTNEVNGDLSQAEDRMGYTFSDKGILELCFTHKSLSGERNNDRLEFLGDAVLGYAVSEKLYEEFPERDEGFLTEEKICYVSKGALSQAAKNLGLNEFVRVGGGESKQNWDVKSISNIFEAAVGAIYLDGGLAQAKEFIFKHIVRLEPEANAKDALVKYADKHKIGVYEFKVTDERKDGQSTEFTVEFILNGGRLSSGKGRNKKLAESKAAAAAFKILQEKEQ